MSLLTNSPTALAGSTYSPAPTTQSGSFFSSPGGWYGIFSGIGSFVQAYGARIQAKIQKQNLMHEGRMASINGKYAYQSSLLSAGYTEAMARVQSGSVIEMAKINQRISELGAQSALMSGERQVMQFTNQLGKVKSAQKVALAANGVDLGEGSALEAQVTTGVMGEFDRDQITNNALMQAWGYRTQGTAQMAQAVGEAANINVNAAMSAANTRMQGAKDLFDSKWQANASYAASNSISPDRAFNTTLISSAAGAYDSWRTYWSVKK